MIANLTQIIRSGLVLILFACSCLGCTEPVTDPLYDAGKEAFLDDKRNYEPLQGKIFDLLSNQDYEAVETLIASIEAMYKSGELSEFALFQSYGALDTWHKGLLPKINQWIKEYPQSHRAYYARGSYYAAKGKKARGGKYRSETPPEKFEAMYHYFTPAVIDLNKSLELNPSLLPAYIRLIDIYKNTGDRDSLDAIYQMAISADLQSYYARSVYAGALLPKWGGSYELLNKFIHNTKQYYDLNPRLIALEGIEHARKGQTKYVKKDYDGAIKDYTRALEYAPLTSWYSGRARSYNKLGSHSKEIENLDEVLYFWPTAAYSMAQRASVYAKLGKNGKAFADANQAMALAMNFAIRADTFRKCAWVFEILGDHEQAAVAYEKSIEEDPDHSYALRRLGRIYSLHLNRSQEAIQHFERLTELEPEDPQIWLYFGDALEDLDDPRARDSLQKYLSLVDHSDQSQRQIISQVKRYLETGEKP